MTAIPADLYAISNSKSGSSFGLTPTCQNFTFAVFIGLMEDLMEDLMPGDQHTPTYLKSVAKVVNHERRVTMAPVGRIKMKHLGTFKIAGGDTERTY